ncbi:MAG: CBS domain-containing protein [Rhodocyclaceae bacterium]|nr:MAG: CBS domain-containing protein [Rhodocyclaceae bacterium]
MKDWKQVIVSPEMSLRDALARIDASGIQLAVVTDADGRLQGLLSDGDVRRALLRGVDLSIRTAEVMNPNPVVADPAWSRQELLAVMRRKVLHHIPLVDANRFVTGLATLDELAGIVQHSNCVVLMAGGLGSRLRPLTENCPKPMLHVGGKPILENILEGFVEQGFCNFFISVNYMAETIMDHFGDGSRWGVSIRYLREDKRLGTAGALSLLPSWPQEPFFVMNGDLLTKVRFDAMLQFHKEHQASATMAVREYDFQVPYGVVRMNGTRIEGIDEKPVQKFFVNAGIYVLSPDVMNHVPSDQYLDMPNLFDKVTAAGKTASAFPLREYWLDIGRLEEFEKAQDEWTG